ncbi:MAG: outer membrane protein assembly factor BamE [Rhodospirillales bacterium]|jgi:outer membrane protein assembly factor BamE (lipoprotein component of BamABCDE complex)|nr:outer membrane protein assembly factor BamE [Rhodospirillales bacterium]
MARPFRSVSAVALFALPLFAAGCTPNSANRGNLVEADRLALVQNGSSKDEVFQTLGSPTMISTFDDNTWYYMGQRTEQTAFFDPDIVERQVLVVRFDDKDKVNGLQKMTGDQTIAQIDTVERTTPTSGKEMGFLEQLIGNVGRFGGDKKKPGSSGGGGGRSRGY